MRTPIIAGNWKMNATLPEALALTAGVREAVGSRNDVQVVLVPPFPLLAAVIAGVKGSQLAVGAQNLFVGRGKDGQPAHFGAYTGEVSAPMLSSIGVRYVIVGHSERRQYFGETDEGVNLKTRMVLANAMIPIVCVGERLDEREAGITLAVVQRQVAGALSGIPAEALQTIILAYEPVWAIGTGKVATVEQAQEVHGFIRHFVEQEYGPAVAQAVRIQYGGSVTPESASGLLAQPDIDGALVGGASLKAGSFAAIVRSAYA